MANTLYATKRARPDTCMALTFLTTRVHASEENNWYKLVHLMQYIRGVYKLSLTLSAKRREIFKWCVDVLFAVYPNMRGQSGGGLSLGLGFPIVGFTKQKLSTNFSTDT